MYNFSKTDFNVKEIAFAGKVLPSTGFDYHFDRINHGIALHAAGRKTYKFADGINLTVNAGDLIYLPKHSTYDVDIHEGGDCYCINFDDEVDMYLPPFVIKPKNFNSALDIFQTLDKFWRAKKDCYRLKCTALLYELLYSLCTDINSEYTPKSREMIIRPAVNCIHENYTTGAIDIEDLAKLCKISSAYFRKQFKAIYGCTPVEYINGLKLRRAGELVASGMYSVREAAEQSGYSDCSHFSREFKKHFGVAPSRYAK